MKRIICLFLSAMMVFTTGVYAFAVEEMQVVINGVPLVSDQSPIMRDDRVFVPIRAIAEALGASVMWGNGIYEVTIENEADDTEVNLGIDERTCMINNIRSLMDTPPFIENSRTMVPVRLISQAFGCNVRWDNTSRTVYIENVTSDNETRYESIKADSGKPLVYDAFSKQIDSYDYRLPALNINSDQAQSFSGQIEAIIKPWIDKAIEDFGSIWVGVTYRYAVYNDILSVVVRVINDTDCDLYYSFNYDIAEDKQITNEELLRHCGGDVDANVSIIQNYCQRLFDLRYPVREGNTVEERFYYTSAPSYYEHREAAGNDRCYNINSPLYLNEAGQLYAIVDMPSLAGAWSYMHSIDTSLSIQ